MDRPPHCNYVTLEDPSGIVVAHTYHHVSRNHRLPANHESREITASRLLMDCRRPISNVAAIEEFSAMEESNYPHAVQC